MQPKQEPIELEGIMLEIKKDLGNRCDDDFTYDDVTRWAEKSYLLGKEAGKEEKEGEFVKTISDGIDKIFKPIK